MSSGDFGGMEKVVTSLATCFFQAGVPVAVFVIIETRAGAERTEHLRKMLELMPKEIPLHTFPTDCRYSRRLQQKLALALEAAHVGIVHCHCYKSAFYLSRIRRGGHLQHVPLVFTLHGIFLIPTSLSSIAIYLGYLYTMFHVNAILLCAGHLRSQVRWSTRLGDKCRIVPNALPPSPLVFPRSQARNLLATSYHLDQQALWIVNIGRLAPEKNFDLFLDIAIEVKKHCPIPVQFLIIGTGSLLQSLQERTQQLNLTESVFFTGFVDNIPLILAAIDIFVMTSNTEGTSMALLEALYAGLPIVATEVGGNSDILHHGFNGLLFPPHDIARGSQAILNLCANDELRRQLGDNAHLTWEKHYAPNAWVERHMEIYRNLLTSEKTKNEPIHDEATSPSHTIAMTLDSLQIGGAEMLALRIAQGFTLEGHSPVLVALGNNGNLGSALHQNSIAHLSLQIPSGISFRLMWRIYRVFKQQRCTLVISNHFRQLFHTFLPAIFAGIPHLHIEHDNRLYKSNSNYLLLLRLFLIRLHCFIVVSPTLKQWFIERLPQHQQNIEAIANGVDTELFCPSSYSSSILRNKYQLKQDCIVFGTCARFEAVKNLDLMLGVFAAYHATNPNSCLLLVGDGSCRNHLQEQADALGISSVVFFPGMQEDVVPWLQAMDIYLVTSDDEGLPLSVLEAMACGVPVIARDVGDLPRLLTPNVGRLVRGTDINHWLHILKEVADSKPNRLVLAANCRQLIAERYSLAGCLSRYKELITSAD